MIYNNSITETGEQTKMTVSKKQMDTNNAWTNKNMKLVGVKIRREDADRFTELCKANGETPYSALKDFIYQYISEHQAL